MSGCTNNNQNKNTPDETPTETISDYLISSDDSSIKDYEAYEGSMINASNTTGLIEVDAEWNIKLDNKPVFFSDITETNLFVNNDLFNDLSILNATYIDNYERIIIGRYKGSEENYKEIINMLIKSQVVNTYDHISADVKLVEERVDSEKYTSFFEATHRYCTNECTSADYSFKIEIEKETGIIRLLGPIK